LSRRTISRLQKETKIRQQIEKQFIQAKLLNFVEEVHHSRVANVLAPEALQFCLPPLLYCHCAVKAEALPLLLQDSSDREGAPKLSGSKLLSRLAVTVDSHPKAESLRAKGAFLIYHLEQVIEMGVQLVPYMVTYYFIGHINLWGEVTLLWSHPRCYMTFLKSFCFCFTVALVSLIISHYLPSPCLPFCHVTTGGGGRLT
jgi:hypothetical protein